MSSFHDEVFSEIDAARKLAADFANRHGRKQADAPRPPSEADRLAQEQSAAAEIAALAAEEQRLASQAQERAERRAKAREEELAKAANGEIHQKVRPALEPAASRWNAATILKGLATLRLKERSAAEEMIRKAHEFRDENQPAATNSRPAELSAGAEPHATPVRGMWSPSLGGTQVWYFTTKGTRCGPVTFEELQTMAASQMLDPRLDMVWMEGMNGWKQAGHLDGLFERRSVPTDIVDRRGGKKHLVSTALPTDLTAALASKHINWPGVGRLPLWLGLLLFPLLWNEALWWSTPILVKTFGNLLMSRLLTFAAFVPLAVLIYLILTRLVNVGMSRWWALVLAIPVLNLWVGYRCLICPSGYAYHRKLDSSGKAIALAVVSITPLVWYIHLEHPGLLSLGQFQTALHRLVEGAVKMISQR